MICGYCSTFPNKAQPPCFHPRLPRRVRATPSAGETHPAARPAPGGARLFETVSPGTSPSHRARDVPSAGEPHPAARPAPGEARLFLKRYPPERLLPTVPGTYPLPGKPTRPPGLPRERPPFFETESPGTSPSHRAGATPSSGEIYPARQACPERPPFFETESSGTSPSHRVRATLSAGETHPAARTAPGGPRLFETSPRAGLAPSPAPPDNGAQKGGRGGVPRPPAKSWLSLCRSAYRA